LENGFENIITAHDDENIFVAYENRVFRYEPEALLSVMKTIKESIDISKKNSVFPSSLHNIVLIPLKRQIPVAAIEIPVNELEMFFNGRKNGSQFINSCEISFDVDYHWDKIKNIELENSGSYKLDLVVYPEIKTELDEFDDPWKLQFSFLPSIETTLGRGSLLKLQYNIPVVYRKFDVDKEVDAFRPGIMNFNQTVRVSNTYISASFGFFTEYRYGADLEIRNYFFDGIFSTGMNFGFTGESFYHNGGFEFTRLNETTYHFDAELRVPFYNLTFTTSYGQYIYEDEGYRVDLSRQLGEVSLGFFVSKSSSNQLGSLTTGGFSFTVPLPFKKYSKINSIRVRPSENITYEYNALHFIYFHQKKYKTGSDIKSFINNFQKDIIIHYFNNINLTKK
jgi:hypothetical protein